MPKDEKNSDKTKERNSRSECRQENASSEMLGMVKQVDLCVHISMNMSTHTQGALFLLIIKVSGHSFIRNVSFQEGIVSVGGWVGKGGKSPRE